ncbi:MAG TPA: hypothetical protein VKD22_07010 [Ramlibacter sp.]|nr:hypothetical protein [Ramlibacter sp.]
MFQRYLVRDAGGSGETVCLGNQPYGAEIEESAEQFFLFWQLTGRKRARDEAAEVRDEWAIPVHRCGPCAPPCAHRHFPAEDLRTFYAISESSLYLLAKAVAKARGFETDVCAALGAQPRCGLPWVGSPMRVLPIWALPYVLRVFTARGVLRTPAFGVCLRAHAILSRRATRDPAAGVSAAALERVLVDMNLWHEHDAGLTEVRERLEAVELASMGRIRDVVVRGLEARIATAAARAAELDDARTVEIALLELRVDALEQNKAADVI